MSQPLSVIQRTFGAGELAPATHARADLAGYSAGLRTCRNFIVRREGGADNRPGFRFTGACKATTAGARLRVYLPSTGDGFLVELGAGYFRFYRNGARVTVAGVAAYNAATAYVPGDLALEAGVHYYNHTASTGVAPPNAANWHALTGTIYEIPTPYALASLPSWQQEGRIVSLTHLLHAPRELVYASATRWTLRTVATGPSIAAPAGLAGVTPTAGARTFSYVVTALSADAYEESLPTAPVVVPLALLPTADAPIALTWTPLAGAAEYNVYCDAEANGVHGFIGTAAGALFNDVGREPDYARTPPKARALFLNLDEFPAIAANYQQRRVYAQTTLVPDGLWASRAGLPTNFSIRSPLQADDAVTLALAGNNNHAIRHMVALKSGLILLTDGGAWPLTGSGGPKNPITPFSREAEQETYVGASPTVAPVAVGNAVIYVQSRGRRLHDLSFDQVVEGLAGRDLSTPAAHLFSAHTITAIAYQYEPNSIVWAVRSDGTLLGVTYLRESEIWGWHRHDTGAGGRFEDVVVVPEAGEDVVYCIVARTIGGATVRYVERLEDRNVVTWDTDVFFVDAGVSYSGAPATVFAGLGHLEGQVVAVVGDGDVIYNGDPAGAAVAQFTVTAGVITLTAAKSNVHIGLPIRFGDLELLDLDDPASDARDRKKRVQSVSLLIDKSARGFSAGPDASNLTAYAQQAYETVEDSHTGKVEIGITSRFDEYGRVFIRQTDPLPLTVLGIIPNVEVGG